jgi:acyl-CoA thioester hydrolase
MKPPSVPLEKVLRLDPIYSLTIPEQFRDANGHMNMRYYLHVYDDAGDQLVARFGLTADYHHQHHTGGFDLEHHIHYLKEVQVGETVTVYPRLLGRSAKRIHYMLFMVNDTQQTVASIFECINSFADLTVRRTAPYPAEIAAQIDQMLAAHQQLDWPAPICGVMAP